MLWFIRHKYLKVGRVKSLKIFIHSSQNFEDYHVLNDNKSADDDVCFRQIALQEFRSRLIELTM